MYNHIHQSGQEIPRSRVSQIHQDALIFLEEIRPSLFINERGFIFESLLSKAIPSPKLLNQTIDQLYPNHIAALCKAGLTPRNFPTLNQLLLDIESKTRGIDDDDSL